MNRTLVLAVVSAALGGACAAPNSPGKAQENSADAAQRAALNEANSSSAVEPAPPFRPIAGIRELMDSEIDPAADFLWDSVASISTRAGLEERQPRTDEEWLEVRRHAMRLVEAPNLLVIKGRRVSNSYVPSAGPGELDTNEVQKKIDENRAAFIGLAQNLQDTAVKTLAAVDAKDPVALFELGGDIDEACEACHVTFWYPSQLLPYK